MGDWYVINPEATTNYIKNPQAGATHIVGAELLSNTGFETAGGGGADVWANWSETAGDGAIADEAVIIHGGAHAAKLTSGPLSNTEVNQSVTVTPGELYLLDLWTQGDGANSGRYEVYDVTNAADIIATASLGVTGAAYSECLIAFVAPAACVSVRLYLWCPATNGGITYFDDVSIRHVNVGPVSLTTTLERSASYTKYGAYSWHILSTADNDGAMLEIEALPGDGASYMVTMLTAGQLPVLADVIGWDWSLNDTNYYTPTAGTAIDGTWTPYSTVIQTAHGVGSTTLYIRQNNAGAGNFYLDGIQIEARGTTHFTTYTDGEQKGCEWDGQAHNSTSSRSAQSRAGGRAYDLATYDFDVGGMFGVGMPTVYNEVDAYALLPGGEFNAGKIGVREMSLAGILQGTSFADLLDNRRSLIDLLKPDLVAGNQPFILRYTGGTTYKEIEARYIDGLDAALDARFCDTEQNMTLRFLAPDPMFYEIGESSTVLDSNDSATFKLIARRLKSSGQWDPVGPPAAGGTYTDVRTICHAKDGCYYIGGNFVNWDNDANSDYIVKYDPIADAYVSIGNAVLNGVVRHIVQSPDPDVLYIGGAFTAAGGDGAADGFATYTISTDTYGHLGDPDSAGGMTGVNKIAVAQNGDVYIVGNFLNCDGQADADYAAFYDISATAWDGFGSGASAECHDVAVHPGGDVYMVGEFTNWGDANGDYVIKWTGSALVSLSTGANVACRAVAINSAGDVFIGGNFTTIGGESINRLARWNGTSFEPCGTGTNNVVYSLDFGPDEMLYLSGDFTTAGGITVNRFARFNGSVFLPVDIDLPGTPTVYAVVSGPEDPVIPAISEVWVGFNTATTGTYAGDATVTSGGTARAYPYIRVNRDGGTTAKLISIRNATTGKELAFDYDLLDGETLTIDLHPSQKTVVSDLFGPRLDAVLGGSDFGEFALQPGANIITCFVDTAGSPTITATMFWKDTYWSIDD